VRNKTICLSDEQTAWLEKQPKGISPTIRDAIDAYVLEISKPPEIGALLADEAAEKAAGECWSANWNSERGRKIIQAMKFERKGVFFFLTPRASDKIEFAKRWENE
jgi:hypothetical protein